MNLTEVSPPIKPEMSKSSTTHFSAQKIFSFTFLMDFLLHRYLWMSKILFLLAFLFGFISFADSAKPFRRVLVLGGGGLQTAIYLGIIDGLEKNGWKPDLIISTCGSSIAAAILNGEGHIQGASNYIFSKDYYALLNEVQIENSFALPIASRIFNNDFIGFYPQVYDKSILNIPFELKSTYKDRAMEKHFASSAQGAIPIIIIAAKAGFGPNQVGDKILNKKFITETFFTDADTAEKIPKSFTSPLAQNFPESFVLIEMLFKTKLSGKF